MEKIKLFEDPRHTVGTKMAVAFEVPFMAHIEKQLLAFSPHKPISCGKGSSKIFFKCGP